MPSYSSVAAKVAADKKENPAHYCPRCLWKIVKRDGSLSPCQRHPLPTPPVVEPTPEPAKCRCPYVLKSVGRHLPTCPEYELVSAFADVDEISDDDPRLADDNGVGFVETDEYAPTSDNPWFVRGVYYASSYDAEIERRRQAEKARRMGERLARVIQRIADNQTNNAAD